MHKKSLRIRYSELQSNINLKGNESVFVENNGQVKEYKIINTEEELSEYTLNILDYVEKDIGLIITFECSNWISSFNNSIFLKNFNIDYCSKPQEMELLFLNFQNCEFFGCVNLMGGDYEDIVINNSIFRKELFIGFINCKSYFCTNNLLKNNVAIKNSTFNKFFFNSTQIDQNLYFEEDSMLEDFKFEKSKLFGNLDFIDCTFEGPAKFSKLSIEQTASLNLSHCSFYKISEINFNIILGKVSIYKTNFSDKCYFEYELLEKQNFLPLISQNNLKTTKCKRWNTYRTPENQLHINMRSWFFNRILLLQFSLCSYIVFV
ncbi:hypothetical protein [Clostridium thailandense]|uniref:hypothetical protein n=1 Tax=Clostridium thailandense TaxID=2794346 RepID=UPI00398A2474